MSYRPKGETTHYILRVASAPSPSVVTDSLDFRVADAPLQIQFASAKCVRCASLRSGGAPIGGQENDRVSYLCSAPYTLLPLRGISPQGETRDMERKTGRHILHVPLQCVPLWWRTPPPFPRSSVGRQKESALMDRLGALLRPTWRSYAGPPQGTTTRAYCRARKCTPFGGWRHHLPPGGGTLFFAMR